MNTKLLQKVANAILDEPRNFDMSWFVAPNLDSPCGTTACIAGHALAISKKYKTLKELYGSGVSDNARSALDLERRQRDRLFFRSYWPTDFADASKTASPDEGAEIAFWRIQHFIATNGAE